MREASLEPNPTEEASLVEAALMRLSCLYLPVADNTYFMESALAPWSSQECFDAAADAAGPRAAPGLRVSLCEITRDMIMIML